MADLMRRQRIHVDCGVDVEQAFDPNVTWMVDHTQVCQACATKEMVMRDQAKQHEKESEKPTPGVPMWREGRMVTVRAASEADLRAARSGRLQTQRR